MSNVIAIQENHRADTTTAIFSPDGLAQLQRFADTMAKGAVTVPKHLVGKPADCLAVAMQAAQWGMNPYAVAQKTHVVNGALGYEAQLVNAVVSSSKAIVGHFHYEYVGDWETIVGKIDKRDEAGLGVRVGAVLRGDADITWLDTLYMLEVTTRNSPLWKTRPKQQLAYLGVKYWARLYCPEVILGVYTPDEMGEPKPRMERDITPDNTSASLSNLINNVQPSAPSQDEKPKETRSNDDLLSDFTESAGNAKSIAELDKFYKYAAKKLADSADHLDAATDIYSIRKDELAEVPM